jgi:hypothetical protein
MPGIHHGQAQSGLPVPPRLLQAVVHLGVEVFEFLGAVAGHDQGGVFGLYDDEVFAAQEGDGVAGFGAAEIVFGFPLARSEEMTSGPEARSRAGIARS